MLKASGESAINIHCELGCGSCWLGGQFYLNSYKGKGDTLERVNYRGLKLLEHVTKVVERIVEG